MAQARTSRSRITSPAGFAAAAAAIAAASLAAVAVNLAPAARQDARLVPAFSLAGTIAMGFGMIAAAAAADAIAAPRRRN
jgi:hypothetical protein